MQRFLLSLIMVLTLFACAKEVDELIPKETVLEDPEIRDEILVR